MSVSAIVCLAIVWTLVISGNGYCFYKLLTSPRHIGSSDDEQF